jgi:NADH:ubiquinone oxidoreductase subunit 2 (subunit N)
MQMYNFKNYLLKYNVDETSFFIIDQLNPYFEYIFLYINVYHEWKLKWIEWTFCLEGILFYQNNVIDTSSWLIYSKWINLCIITTFILFLGMGLNKSKHVKFLHLTSAFFALIHFYLISLNFNYNFLDINILFNQNVSLFVNIFIIIATISLIFYFLSISDIFYLEENMKVEFSFLIWFIYIASIFLISSKDFIAIIILLECIAFSSYILVGFERKNKFSATSALKYLILAAVPGGLFILGLSLLYNNFGSFSQDYLFLLLETMNVSNWYQFEHTDKNFIEIFNCINESYNINIDYIYTSYYAHCDVFLYKYLTNLNSFLKIYNPTLLLDLYILEHILINKTFYTFYFNVDEFLLIKNLYKILWLEFFEVFKELFFFKKIIELCFFFENYNFTNPKVFKWLYDNQLLYILNWFSAMSFSVFFRELVLDEITNVDIISRNIFCTDTFQIKNIMRLSLLIEENINSYNLNDLYNFQDQVQNTRYLYFTNAFFLNTFFIDSEIFEKTNLYINSFYELIDSNFLNFINIKYNFYYFNTSLIIYLSLTFIIINLAFKLTAAPFHFWAPSVYGGSPLPTITFLSIFSKLTICFLMSWLLWNTFYNFKDIWQIVLFCLAIFSILFSILGAFTEKIFKRFFIYSSTGHVGFMLIGMSVLDINGLTSTFDYLILYIISSFIIWFIIMHLSKKTNTLVNLKHLSFNQSTLSYIFSIVIFSLSGIPPLGGFFVKYEIFYSLINTSFFFFAYFLLILTVISFFYYLRLIKIIFFENNVKFIKNKYLNKDIKLRIISFLFFLIPFFLIYMDTACHYILKESLKSSFY